MNTERPSAAEQFKLSCRYWFNNLLGRTKQFPSASPTLVGEMKNVLAVVIQHEGEYLFVHVPKEDEVRPILVDVDDVMENQLLRLKHYFRQEFNLQPDNVRFSPYTFNLAPLSKVKFYLALVHLPKEDFLQFKEYCEVYTASKVLLARDTNIFFEALARKSDRSHVVL